MSSNIEIMDSKKFITIFGYGHSILFGIFITLYIRHYWFLAIISLVFLTLFHAVAYFYAPEKQQKTVLFIYFCLIAANITIFSDIYSDLGIIDSYTGKPVFDRAETLYFSIVTWTTLGYGDFKPSVASRYYAATQAALGYFYMGLFVGYFIHYLIYHTRNRKRHNKANAADAKNRAAD